MSKLTDAELQALVYQTGITPVDKLPKPDPKAELVSFLSQVSVSINGAVKCGAAEVRSPAFPAYPAWVYQEAEPILTQLGYHVEICSKCGDTSLRISGWA